MEFLLAMIIINTVQDIIGLYKNNQPIDFVMGWLYGIELPQQHLLI
jgi:hypothetical protein